MNRSLWVLQALFLFCACATPDLSTIHMVGHGGMGEGASDPMNSRESVLSALSLQLDGVEVDVQMTSDSVLVAYHAQYLEEHTACSGLINSMTWAQLVMCQVGNGMGKTYPIERLDSLLLNATRSFPGKDFTLDCKLFAAGDWWPYLVAYSRAIVALNRWPAIQGRIVVECQLDEFLSLLQRDQPYIPLFKYANDMEEATYRAATSHFTGVVVSNDRVNSTQVQYAQELGLEVTIFGITDRFAYFRALRKAPDRIQTDRPDIVDQ